MGRRHTNVDGVHGGGCDPQQRGKDRTVGRCGCPGFLSRTNVLFRFFM